MVLTPPLKMQGIKTKLIPFIKKHIHWHGKGRWIEPFLGSGVVLFNVSPQRALVCDSNPHVIRFYQAMQSRDISAISARKYLSYEGARLQQKGEEHYYDLRERFNKHLDPMDFLFLNRSCFNGLMRFNAKGEFNTPFCRKPERFRKAYISKICNQIHKVSEVMQHRQWEFVCADWRETMKHVESEDCVYADPPYEGRFTDYYNSWRQQDGEDLERCLKQLPAPFLYSMWAENVYRHNTKLYESFEGYSIETFEHFYHLGAKESLRNSMKEALVVGGW